MRLFKAYGPQLLLATCVTLFGARAGFAQSNGDQFQSGWYCENVTDYAQFCDFVIGVSTLTIDADGALATSALTEPVWGFYVNMTQCRAEGGQQLSDCIPFQPKVSASVSTEIMPSGISDSANSDGGEAELDMPKSGTLRAVVTGNWQESSTHEAYFNPPGNGADGTTQASVSYCPGITLQSSMNMWLTPGLNFPAYKTGIGTEDVMLLGPASDNLSDVPIYETMSVVANSCPWYVKACNATGGLLTGLDQSNYTTFGYPIPPLPYLNAFYDEHVLVDPLDDLGAPANMSSCQIMCMHTYSTDGCPSVTSYTLIKWLNHSAIGQVPVTVVTMSQ